MLDNKLMCLKGIEVVNVNFVLMILMWMKCKFIFNNIYLIIEYIILIWLIFLILCIIKYLNISIK